MWGWKIIKIFIYIIYTKIKLIIQFLINFFIFCNKKKEKYLNKYVLM